MTDTNTNTIDIPEEALPDAYMWLGALATHLDLKKQDTMSSNAGYQFATERAKSVESDMRTHWAKWAVRLIESAGYDIQKYEANTKVVNGKIILVAQLIQDSNQ